MEDKTVIFSNNWIQKDNKVNKMKKIEEMSADEAFKELIELA